MTQKKWRRIALLSVLGYEGLGGVAGGGLLVAAPDGRYMDMPVGILHGVFADFRVPGIILLCMAVIDLAAFVMVLRRKPSAWLWALGAMIGFVIWFYVEIVVIEGVHWLHGMWGLPVLVGLWTALPLVPAEHASMRKALLVGGICSSVLYVTLNIFIPRLWPEYNSLTQTVSELSAVDAPTRYLWNWLCAPYTLLMVGFGIGVWLSAGSNRSLRIAGILLTAYGSLGIFWPFAPMHLRETLAQGGGTISDTMHIVLASVTQVIYLFALGFTAFALGRQFRLYSLATFILLFIFGILTFLEAPGIAANEPTPLIGLWERLNIGLFLVWVVVLATTLLRTSYQRMPSFQVRAEGIPA